MKPNENTKTKPLQTFDDESFIFEQLRLTPSNKIKYCGRLFRCFRIEKLLKSIFFYKSWINTSSKSDIPPDFHNDRHHIMMDIMRVDDSASGKHGPNSFERTHKYLKKNIGKDYKKKMGGSSLYFIPNTMDDSQYNFKGYVRNFERILMDHSDKVSNYHQNYPKCKTCILFVFDESNAYYQDMGNERKLIHLCFCDKKFLDVVKQCKSDYVAWFAFYKTVLDNNGKEIKMPLVCIYDVKHIKKAGIEYDYNKMIKVK